MLLDRGGRESSPALLRRRLASELRRLRKASGFTTEQVARHLYCSVSKISRVETARVAATLSDVRDLLDLFRVTGQQREKILKLAREALQKEAWWQAYGDLREIRTYLVFRGWLRWVID
jgi:transcriptional regulator with XRE-family HTH domain